MSSVAKSLLFGADARERTLAGVRKLNKAVAATLGPKGRNALCEQGWGQPMITKDGVTVAKQINLPDPFEQMGNRVVREAASRTNARAGDGTTTATILAAAIMEEGVEHLGAGANPLLIRKGIDRAVRLVVEELQRHTETVKSVEDLVAIATISAQDAEIGRIAAHAVWDAGVQGIVSVEKSRGLGLESEKADGFAFDRGYVTGHMVTEPRTGEAIYEDVRILLYEGDMTAHREVLPLMEMLLKGDPSSQRPSIKHLVIICENVLNEALSAVVVNSLKGNFFTLALRAPGQGETREAIMEDIAARTGATYISKKTGRKINTVTWGDLGYARRVIATANRTIIVDGGGKQEAIAARVEALEGLLREPADELAEKVLKERLAALTGKAVVVKVGSATETEQTEKQYRVEDALCACRAALAEGVLPGAGVPYLRASVWLASQEFENAHEDAGRQIIVRALKQPMQELALNAGMSPEVMMDTTLGLRWRYGYLVKEESTVQYDYGYDALREEWCKLLEVSVLDPLKVAREALENAASVAGTWLTLETAIVEIPPAGADRINLVSPQELASYESINP